MRLTECCHIKFDLNFLIQAAFIGLRNYFGTFVEASYYASTSFQSGGLFPTHLFVPNTRLAYHTYPTTRFLCLCLMNVSVSVSVGDEYFPVVF